MTRPRWEIIVIGRHGALEMRERGSGLWEAQAQEMAHRRLAARHPDYEWCCQLVVTWGDIGTEAEREQREGESMHNADQTSSQWVSRQGLGRRDFLRASAYAGVTFLLAPLRAADPAAKPLPTRVLGRTGRKVTILDREKLERLV